MFLRRHISVGVIHEKVIDDALNAGWTDLEGAIQYYSVCYSGCTEVIIRNKKDFFSAKEIPVFSPDEFVERFLSERE